MKVFISILFSLFFVPVALSDELMYDCPAGKYLPVSVHGCKPCHASCPAGEYLPINGQDCLPCSPDSCSNKPLARGLYCPGAENLIFSLVKNQGIFGCPEGFPYASANNQQDDKRCYASFHFYPGEGTTFREAAPFAGDQSYDTIMYYKVDSDLFTASTDGLTHKLKPEFITGASVPTNPKYYFNGWKWGMKANNGGVSWVNVDENTNIKSEGDDTEEYRHIKAKWTYDVMYIVDATSLYAVDFDIESGEKHTLPTNTGLKARDVNTGNLLNPEKYLTRDGYVFKGWCPHPLGNDLCNNGADILKPGKTICDTEGCGATKKLVPNNQKYVYLYAVFGTCESGNHRVANASTNKCICDRGYYGAATDIDEQTDCTRCPNGKTTISTGKTSVNDCIHRFTFKTSSGSTDIWAWPSSVDTSGTVSNIH